MSRIRTIKPDFWRDDALSAVSAEAALLAIGLLNHSDDEGYFNANPKLIEADVFPLRELASSITVLLRELSKIGYLTMFLGSDGKKYGLVCNFAKHQVINKPRASKIKALCTLPDNSGSDTVHLPVGMEGNGNGNGKEVEVKKASRATALCPQDVDPSVWEDWKQLRKSKRATVSETVVEQARKEATKANMSLNSFLKEWCLRGSQGLKAEWLTNNQNDKRTEHQRRQDAQTQAIFGHIYNTQQPTNFIEGEVYEEPPITRRLGR
jgi:hypothetical protein